MNRRGFLGAVGSLFASVALGLHSRGLLPLASEPKFPHLTVEMWREWDQAARATLAQIAREIGLLAGHMIHRDHAAKLRTAFGTMGRP